MSLPDGLNADCVCLSLDRVGLARALETAVGDPAFCAGLQVTHPSLVSSVPVFLTHDHAVRMAEIIGAIEAIAKTAPYQDAALAWAPDIARFNPGPVGVFMGYDFHIGAEGAVGGPQLIEINTNAGGGLINAFVAGAQKACCMAVETLFPGQMGHRDVPANFVAAFRAEWHRQRGDRALTSIAIVDRDPTAQYLYPEFVLFQRLFESHGIAAVIAAPGDFQHHAGQLHLGGAPIDLVYNRSTDFAFAEPDHAALRSAYLAGDVVVTPHPHAHALFADKRNLVALSDRETLTRWGISAGLIDIVVAGVPKTRFVTPESADALWTARNGLFFKPAGGFGSKAAYRGDKVTRGVFAEIVAGSYVAQDIVRPSARNVLVDGVRQAMKVDVRNYTYDGAVQLVAARLYQGQTTNFRTPGGGFSPVFWRATDDILPVRCPPASGTCG
jgi:hypothetical protein